MQHTNAWHGHCSIPLFIGQIWLPNSAVFNFVTRQRWLKIVNSTWHSSGAIFFPGHTCQDFSLMWPRDPKRIVRDKKTEAWGIHKTGQSERRHEEHLKFFGAGLVNSFHKPSHPLHWGYPKILLYKPCSVLTLSEKRPVCPLQRWWNSLAIKTDRDLRMKSLLCQRYSETLVPRIPQENIFRILVGHKRNHINDVGKAKKKIIVFRKLFCSIFV